MEKWLCHRCDTLNDHVTDWLTYLLIWRHNITEWDVHKMTWCCCINMLTVSTSPWTDLVSDRYDSAVDSQTISELTDSEMPSDVPRSITSAFLSRLYHSHTDSYLQHCHNKHQHKQSFSEWHRKHLINNVTESEQILNGTSAQLGYTVPIRLVYTGKYRTEDKSRTDTTKNKDNLEKANSTKYSRPKLAWFSRLLRHSARKQGGLILQRSWAHTG